MDIKINIRVCYKKRINIYSQNRSFSGSSKILLHRTSFDLRCIEFYESNRFAVDFLLEARDIFTGTHTGEVC